MSKNKIYHVAPATRREWIELAKTIGELAACVAALYALNWVLEAVAHWVV